MQDRKIFRLRKLKIAGLGFFGCACLGLVGLGWLGLLGVALVFWFLMRRTGIPILTYHSISAQSDWLPWAANISVRPEVFAHHMQVIARTGWTVVTDRTVFSALAGEAHIPRRCVALHFDDAYLDVGANALPVLRQHGFSACIFASSDFIDKSDGIRKNLGPAPRGYFNADELREIDREQLFEIACHGKDHARVPVVGPTSLREDPLSWGLETAYLWSLIPGNKSRWFDDLPPDVVEVPANDSALTATMQTSDGPEDPRSQADRVLALLIQARAKLSAVLDRDVAYLCWPFDRVTPDAHGIAKQAGFKEFTGARCINLWGSGQDSVSRTHINDYAAGPDMPLWIEGLVFRAKLEVAAGNLIWWPVSLLAALRRRRYHRIVHDHLP